MSIGTKHSAITKGRIGLLGGETVGFLDGSSQEAHVQIFVYYSIRDPGRNLSSHSDVPVVGHPGLVSLHPDSVSHEDKNL